jgi:DNA-cytosine methyltransferase
MNVLSLFDGISCAYEAFKRADVKVANYYACEIEKNAKLISDKRHLNIHRPVDDVRELKQEHLPKIDFLVGGSPCQDLSIAKKDREGLEGNRSSLFWEYVRLKNELKPRFFILENVASMPKEAKEIITKEMGVQPVMFNASLVSAQCRKRLFWTNIPFDLPADKGILLKDILQPDAEVDERMFINKQPILLTKPKEHEFKQIGYFGAQNHCKVGGQALRVYDVDGKTTTSGVGLYQISKRAENNLCDVEEKANCLLSSSWRGAQANGTTLVNTGKIRKLTPVECERLQGLPDGYTEGVANTNRYKVLGNAFNVDVITHILLAMKQNEERDAGPMGTQTVDIPEAK